MRQLSFDTFEALLEFLGENANLLVQFHVRYEYDRDKKENAWLIGIPNEIFSEIMNG